jgi:hypothetical protein
MPGWLSNGLVAATPPFTGAETLVLDTNLASGANPQTEAATLNQIKGFIFGNSTAVPTGTMPTATCSGTGGTSTVTLNAGYGILTTDAITTAQAATHVITMTNSAIAATSNVIAWVGYGGNTNVVAVAIDKIVCTAGQAVITIGNHTPTAIAVNGTLKVNFLVLN